jgi:hypothetical protein
MLRRRAGPVGHPSARARFAAPQRTPVAATRAQTQKSGRSHDSILDARRGIAVGDESLTGNERGSIAVRRLAERSLGG